MDDLVPLGVNTDIFLPELLEVLGIVAVVWVWISLLEASCSDTPYIKRLQQAAGCAAVNTFAA